MKPIHRSGASSCRAVLVFSLLTGAVYGDVTFRDFQGTSLDSAGLGVMLGIADPDVNVLVNLTNAGIIGQDGTEADEVANLTDSTSNNDLGVNSVTNVGGYSSEARDFNPGEAWVFTFDVDVELVNINFAGFTGVAEITLSSTAFASDQIITDGDDFSLGDTLLTAGTEVRVEMTSDDGTEEEPNDTGVRLDSLTVSALPIASNGANLRWTGETDNNWNTSDLSPSPNNWDDIDNANADIPFSTEDNVTIDIAATIAVDANGITADGATVSADGGVTVSLSGGNLTTSNLTKSADSILSISDTVDSGILALSAGTLQVGAGGTLNSAILALSGDSTLQVDSGGVFTNSAGGTLSDGGATLQTEEPIILGAMTNSIDDLPFTKTGSGVLTMIGDLGEQSTGPVILDLLGGSLIAASGTQLNVGDTSILNGDVTLDDAKIEFHGSTVSGTGSIIAQSGNARIDARFNGGLVSVANGIIANSDFIVEAPTGDSELQLNGPISGDGNILKDGNGLVVFTGTNTYTGITTVDSGTLAIGGGAGSTSGTLGTGAVILNSTSTPGNLEFRRDDSIVVDNQISGFLVETEPGVFVGGSLTVNGGDLSSVELSEFNDYEGDTVLENGTLVATVIEDIGLASSIGIGSDAPESLQLRGGSLSYIGASDAFTGRTFFLGGGGGTISADGAGSLSFDLSDPVGIGTGVAARTLTLGGSVGKTNVMAVILNDGPVNEEGEFAEVSLSKTGSTTWSVTGMNTYSGDTTVEAGTLILSNDYLADGSAVSIASGAVLDLPHGDADTVTALSLDGSKVVAGTYGSSAAVGGIPGAIVDDLHFTGTGYLIVLTDGASDYDEWASEFGLVGGPTDDDDLDGVTNEDEYAFGLDPTSGASVNPITMQLDRATGLMTYTRRNTTVFSTELTYSYGYSTNLDGNWTPFTPSEESDSGDPVEAITITIPEDLLINDKLFIQVDAE